jgi:hypothetical protein
MHFVATEQNYFKPEQVTAILVFGIRNSGIKVITLLTFYRH